MVNLEQEFRDNWDARESIQPRLRKPDEHLNLGERLYYLIVEVDEALPYLSSTLEFLGHRDELETLPENFLHLTVKTFGTDKPDIQEIATELGEFQPFTAKFRYLNLFPEAVFLESPTPEIREMNRKFAKTFGRRPEDGESFLPHVSLAYYQQENIEKLLDYLEIRRRVEIPEFRTDELVLARDSAEDSSYETVKRFNL
jgi:2'-5' RNA ligase